MTETVTPVASTPIPALAPTDAVSTGRRSLGHDGGFWVVAVAFLTATAFTVVPTPLWSLYQARDGFSTFAVTLAFAAFAVGVLLSLFFVGHISDRFGRRAILIPALLIEAVSAVMFIAWNDLTGLIVDRVVSGIGIGMITATAAAYLFELHGRARPARGRARSDLVSTAANLGGLGFGALASGILAQYVVLPLVTPYLVFAVLLVAAAVGVALVPETVGVGAVRTPYRPQRIRVPHTARGTYFAAGTVTFGAFSLLGLFNCLAPAFVAGDLHVSSKAVAGLIVFLTFASAAGTQVFFRSLAPNRRVVIGVALMVLGLAGITTGVFVSALALFIGGGILAGGGAGVLFTCALQIGGGLAESQFQGEALAGLFLLGYLGLVAPVLGIGIATLSVPLSAALLGFAIAIALLLVAGGAALVRRSNSKMDGDGLVGQAAGWRVTR